MAVSVDRGVLTITFSIAAAGILVLGGLISQMGRSPKQLASAVPASDGAPEIARKPVLKIMTQRNPKWICSFNVNMS